METEIKLLLPPGARAALEADPALADAEARTSRHLSTYYDTPDLALRARGAILRIRDMPEGLVQTVKGPSRADGFASRCECEAPVAALAPDRVALDRDPEARTLVGDDLDRLAPVFVTEIARTARRLLLEGSTEIEVVVDEGEARAGDRRVMLSELELELKAGPPGPLYRLAADLARRHGLRYGAESKSERGYALLTDVLPPHPAPPDLVFEDGVTLAEALPRMIGAGARAIAVDLAGAARGEVEGVHRLRAAIRKLRAIFALFGPHLDPTDTARFNGDLRDLGRVLGQGRDWDVFLTETLAEAEADLGTDALATLRTHAAERGSDARAAVAGVVAGPLPTELLLGLSLWTAGRLWLRDPDDAMADAPLAGRLPDLLDRLDDRVQTRGRRLRSRDGEELHDLRKALKTLRYASEDVSSLFRKKAVRAYVGQIKKVLADLGRINDSVVTETCLAELAASGDPEVLAECDALGAWNAKRRDRAKRELHRHWRKFRHADPFWG